MQNPSVSPWPKQAAKVATSLVALIGSAVLFGWIFDVAVLQSVLPGWIKMSPLTSATFLVASFSLWLLIAQEDRPDGPQSVNRRDDLRAWLLLTSAVAVTMVGFYRLVFYLSGFSSPLDRLGFSDSTIAVAAPVRMAPATAMAFLLIGPAILFARTSRLVELQVFTLLVGFIGWLGLSHYLFQGEPLLPFGQMAAHTATAFLLLALGILCTRTDAGLLSLLMSNTAGGFLARRLVPSVLILPIVFGWLGLQAQRWGWFGKEAGVSVFALANMLFFGALIWSSARLLERFDAARNQAEEKLRRQASLFDQSYDGLIVWEWDGPITFWNRAAQDLYGFTPEQAVGRVSHELLQTRVSGDVDSLVRELERQGKWEGELEQTTRSGWPITVESRLVLVREADHSFVLEANRDITERKQAQNWLQAQLGRHELLNRITRAVGERQDLPGIFQSVTTTLEEELPLDFCCICLYDPLIGELTVSNVGAKSQLLAQEVGLTERASVPVEENGLSRCIQGQLVYEPDTAELEKPFPQRLAKTGLHSLVMSPLAAESVVFGVLVAASLKPNSFSSPDCEFLRQLSDHVALAAHQSQIHTALEQAYEDLRRTQEAIAQQERLHALGQMASGVAHDINNALSPVALYVESVLESEPNLNERTRNYLETVGRAIDDVAATVTRLREFYRQDEPGVVLAPVQLNTLVQQVLDLTRARWSNMPQRQGAVITLRTDFATDLASIMGVESEIRDALTNLILNAVDAMPEGGTLTLRTMCETTADTASSIKGVHVEVVDTGIGMDEETRHRCLEPFFTTKGERGTGLGLAMVYGIIERHGGDINIESTPDRGTTVRLSFPMPQKEFSESIVQEFPITVSPLSILVVDDDPLLLRSLRDTLETEGHQVFTAGGGQAGIDAFTKALENRQTVDVVITDLGMPYVDGRQVAMAVKKKSSHTPVLLLTGWGQRLVAESAVPPHADRVLNKPPRRRELRKALASVMAEYVRNKAH